MFRKFIEIEPTLKQKATGEVKLETNEHTKPRGHIVCMKIK